MTHFILKPFLTIKYHNWTTQNSNNSSATKQIDTISKEKQEFVKWLGPRKTFYNETEFFQRIGQKSRSRNTIL